MKALEWIECFCTTNRTNKDEFFIMTDSQITLDGIKNSMNRDYLLEECRKKN